MRFQEILMEPSGFSATAMWDNTFLQQVGNVVLSLSDSDDILDIQDVMICPG